jgi:hypothetical protein
MAVSSSIPFSSSIMAHAVGLQANYRLLWPLCNGL